MPQNVMITGAGKAVGLGFNLVRRYLEAVSMIYHEWSLDV